MAICHPGTVNQLAVVLHLPPVSWRAVTSRRRRKRRRRRRQKYAPNPRWARTHPTTNNNINNQPQTRQHRHTRKSRLQPTANSDGVNGNWDATWRPSLSARRPASATGRNNKPETQGCYRRNRYSRVPLRRTRTRTLPIYSIPRPVERRRWWRHQNAT